LRDTRARGFSVEDGEVTEGLASIAVALHDHTGWPIASVALTGTTDTIHGELENWVFAVRAVARELSAQHRSDAAR
jgi:DNA-binding IclR family transcriptional regulator